MSATYVILIRTPTPIAHAPFAVTTMSTETSSSTRAQVSHFVTTVARCAFAIFTFKTTLITSYDYFLSHAAFPFRFAISHC